MLTSQVESSQTKDQASLWDDMIGMPHGIPRLWRPIWTSSVTSPNYCSKQRQKEMGCKVQDGDTGTVSSNQKPVFIAAFYTAKHLFGFSLCLSLQGSTLDVIEAYTHVKVVRDQLKVFSTLLTAVINFESVFFLLFSLAIKPDMQDYYSFLKFNQSDLSSWN